MPYSRIGEGVVTYAMLQIGYHGGDMIHLCLIDERQNDFLEMLMHHICAVSLLLSMSFANTMTIGVAISFLHDIADIPIACTKYFGQTNQNFIAAFIMVCNMFIWGYTRLLVLPYMTYTLFTDFRYREDFAFYNPVLTLSGIMLSFMIFLHAFWYKIFMVMIYRAVMTGKSEDIQSRVEVSKKKAE